MSLEKKSYTLNNQEYDLFIYIDLHNNLWFKAKEVALILQYANTNKAIDNNVDNCDCCYWENLMERILNTPLATPSNWQPKTVFINESGLYQLMLRSQKPEAIAFRRWVTRDVLPSIRKTGSYTVATVSDNDRLLTLLEQKEQRLAEQDRRIDEKDRLLAENNNRLIALVDTVITIKPKVAVIPETTELKHSLYILKNNDTYKIIRAQNRSVGNQLKRYEAEHYVVCYKYLNIPNAINVLNKCKEYLKANNIWYCSKHNEIQTKHNIVDLVETIIKNKCN